MNRLSQCVIHQKDAAFTNYFPQVSAICAAFKLNKDLIDISINPAEYIPQSVLPALGQMLLPEALGELSQPIGYKGLDGGVIMGVSAMQPVFMGGQNDLLQVRLKQNELKTAELEVDNGIRTLNLLLTNIVGVDADSLTVDEEITANGFEEITVADTLKGIFNTTKYKLLTKNLEAAQIQKKNGCGQAFAFGGGGCVVLL